jgi:hypothetical protein
MVSAWPSQPGFGEQVAEVVIAIALALPVVFAFAELRDIGSVGAAAMPNAASPLQAPNDMPVTERQSLPSAKIPAGRSSNEISAWGSRVVVLSERTSLTAHDALENTVGGQAGPETDKAADRVEIITKQLPLARKGNRLVQSAPPRASETPREATQ